MAVKFTSPPRWVFELPDPSRRGWLLLHKKDTHLAACPQFYHLYDPWKEYLKKVLVEVRFSSQGVPSQYPQMHQIWRHPLEVAIGPVVLWIFDVVGLKQRLWDPVLRKPLNSGFSLFALDRTRLMGATGRFFVLVFLTCAFKYSDCQRTHPGTGVYVQNVKRPERFCTG